MIGFIISDIKFDQLNKVLSARLLHSKVTLFSFVIKKYFVWEVHENFLSSLFFKKFNFYFVPILFLLMLKLFQI